MNLSGTVGDLGGGGAHGYSPQMLLSGLPRYLEWEHLDGVFWLKLECPQEHFLAGWALHALWKQTTKAQNASG